MAHFNYNSLRPALRSLALFTLAFIPAMQTAHAQTKIGGTAGPGDASAVLELQSTSQGLLPPRMTTTQRNAIANPAEGLTIYNTTTNCIQVYKGAANGGWFDFCNTAGAFSFTNCSSPVITGTLEATKAAAATVTLSYNNATGQQFGAFSSGTVNGITLDAPGGSVTPVTAPGGSITLTVSGTPAADGNFDIPVVLAGAACNIPVTVAPFQGNIPVACGTAPGCTGGVSPAAAVAGDKICWGGFEYYVVAPAGSSGTSTRLWLDRNLGARQLPASVTDALSIGDYYQWGRKGDGHQCTTSGYTTTRATTGDANNGGLFIQGTGTPNYSWTTVGSNTGDGTLSTGLWNNTSADGGVNNPCPPGWRVPTDAELAPVFANYTTSSSNSNYLKVPISGAREWNSPTALSSNTASGEGKLWTLTPASGRGVLARRYGNGASGFVQSGGSDQASAVPVRCIKH